MDVLWFLTERTRFIRSFYDGAASSFVETKRKIEAHEEPFVPPYTEDDEPPFFAEWEDAQTSIEVLGQTCLSMLSDAMKLYFGRWADDLGINCVEIAGKNTFKDEGFFRGYRKSFEKVLGIDWTDSGANLKMLEEVIHARNSAQHPDSITTMNVRHKGAHAVPVRDLFFIADWGRAAMAEKDEPSDSLFLTLLYGPLEVSREALFAALDEFEKLASWLEPFMIEARYPSRKAEP